jgi:8-oxo-dGTP pyrophosphatase MutT (NUDIX family)
MENGESTAQAALRETEEEAGAQILSPMPFLMVNLPQIDQIHLFYRGEMASSAYAAGEESLEVQLFDEQDIPWDDLAFGSVRLCLTLYLEERRQGRFGFHEHLLPVTPHY